jgi:hypothetical protein
VESPERERSEGRSSQRASKPGAVPRNHAAGQSLSCRGASPIRPEYGWARRPPRLDQTIALELRVGRHPRGSRCGMVENRETPSQAT